MFMLGPQFWPNLREEQALHPKSISLGKGTFNLPILLPRGEGAGGCRRLSGFSKSGLRVENSNFQVVRIESGSTVSIL